MPLSVGREDVPDRTEPGLVGVVQDDVRDAAIRAVGKHSAIHEWDTETAATEDHQAHTCHVGDATKG
jgi:hypothetical protein